ncbi:recombinase family protein [Sinomonas soli]
MYLRISQDRTGEQQGVERQREACLKRCAERQWGVAAVESDNDVSAAGKRRRPGFEAMLEAVASGRAQHVVAWSLDRLQRNRHDELRLYDTCKAKGATISLVNGPDIEFSTATGRLIADNLGSLARFEIDLKGDRQRAAQAQAARSGRRSGGRRPFGYEQDGLRVREAEAELVRDGYRAVLAGETLGGIARAWNATGLVPDQKRYAEGHRGAVSSWRRDNVRVVLLNPRNAGKRAYKGEIVSDAVWPAIIDTPTFEAVRAILTDPGRRAGRTSARRLLSGLALCGVCGAAVHAGGAVRRGIANYRCSGALGHVSRMAEPVEDYVVRVVVGRLSMPDAAELMSRADHPDLDGLRAEQHANRELRNSMARKLAMGRVTEEQFDLVTGTTLERDAEIDAQLADAGRADVLGPLVAAADVRAAWDAMTDARKRLVVDTLMTVTVHPPGRGTRTFRPDTVGISWKV